MERDRFASQLTEIRTLMEERLRVRGATLDRQVRKAGRLLPRAVRREAEFLAHAEGLAQNPKLMRMIDPVRADHAYDAMMTWLKTQDPKARRRGKVLNWLALIAFNFLLIVGLVIWFLAWRGVI